MKRLLILYFLLCTMIGSAKSIEPPKREVRGVWLTTAYGLDWPRYPATTPAKRDAQKEELRHILDRLQEANFNTVFLQVRLRGDVIYRSALEPAAKIFSGTYGQMPGYDPLSFAIEECHRRGLECHAWFVTFPLGTEKSVREQGKLSVVKRHPALCIRHNGEWYLDPGVPGTTDYILSLVKEVVLNYDVDGIHFDYIRYPENANAFPDRKSYNRYGRKQSLEMWRRNNINRMVRRIYDWVKSQKPWVQVSSSPLGKYSRIPRVPNAGWTAYESVYQDPVRWIAEGKQDMIVPMMYYKDKNFFPFVDNWVEHAKDRLIIPGLGAYRLEREEGNWVLNDITDQIDYSRSYGGSGCTFFRCGNVLNNTKGIFNELRDNYYRYPAQLLPLSWLDAHQPASPAPIHVERQNNELKLTWNDPSQGKERLTYTLYYSRTNSVDTTAARSILATGIRDTVLYLPINSEAEQAFLFRVSASTRFHIESDCSRETYYYYSKYIK